MQLNEGGGLVETILGGKIQTKLPRIPLRMGSCDCAPYWNLPQAGDGSQKLLESFGFTLEEIIRLKQYKIIV